VLPDAYDMQSYNRYSYVRNNPFKYTDPTGNIETLVVTSPGIGGVGFGGGGFFDFGGGGGLGIGDLSIPSLDELTQLLDEAGYVLNEDGDAVPKDEEDGSDAMSSDMSSDMLSDGRIDEMSGDSRQDPNITDEIVVTGQRDENGGFSNEFINFDFNQFVSFVRDNRSSTALDLAALSSTLLVGTVPKTAGELRALGQKKNLINPVTNQLSRLSLRTGNRIFRRIGRTGLGLGLAAGATLLLVGDGFFNIGIIANGAVRATSFGGDN